MWFMLKYKPTPVEENSTCHQTNKNKNVILVRLSCIEIEQNENLIDQILNN